MGRLSFQRMHDSTRKDGTVCQVYSPRIDCGRETVDASVTLSGLRAALLHEVEWGRSLRMAAGVGVSLNAVSAEATGVSGRRADLYVPNGGQVGYLVALVVGVNPVQGVPVGLQAALSSHWVDFGGCVDPADPTSGYAPFCGVDRFAELEIGVSYAVPRG